MMTFRSDNELGRRFDTEPYFVKLYVRYNMKKLDKLSDYSIGMIGGSVAILCDGQPMSPEEIIARLRDIDYSRLPSETDLEPDKLGKETEPPEEIDYSRLPKGTLVKVWNDSGEFEGYRYFSHEFDGEYYCFASGTTQLTAAIHNTWTTPWRKMRVAANEPRPWFGDDNPPIPDGVRFAYWLRCGYSGGADGASNKASVWKWGWDRGDGDIIAYQILGE